MYSLLPVLAIVGSMVMAFSLSMAVPLAFAWVGGDAALRAHAIAMAITFASGLAIWLATRRFKRELQPRDGFLLVALVWSVLPAFATLPLLLHLPHMSITDAYFEAMSGITTTGSTVMTGLDALPLSINVWRCLLTFMGGMGIIVLAVAILPMLGVGGSQIFRAETPGPMKDTKLTPRIAETARGLWTVYFAIALVCMLAYRAAGMGWADAFMHMCTTIALGGFSSYDASFGAFNSPAIEAVAVVFMMVAGVNFALYFMVWRRRSLRTVWRDAEARAFFGVVAFAVLAVWMVLMAQEAYASPLESLRHAAFNVVSVATTTGFATVDYSAWPLFAPALMLLLACFSTSAGSTGGGIKMARALLLFKQSRRELVRIVHPRAVHPVRMGGGIVDNNVLFAVLAFMLIYGATTIVLTMALLASGLDLVTAASAVVASVNNLGPGLGSVGPAGNFQVLSDFQTWVCSVAMLLGRVELLSILVLFTPQFWQK
jgi:trk system potassium uptake protein TrkH